MAIKSEALTHPCLARAWARRGADLRIQAPGQAKKFAMMGALDQARRELIVHTSRRKRRADFIALLEILDRRHGPRPGRNAKPVVLVLDNGPVHANELTTAALAARDWITVELLPRYATSPFQPGGQFALGSTRQGVLPHDIDRRPRQKG